MHAEIVTERRKAFDVSSYLGFEQAEAQKRLAEDLTTLFLELSENPSHRITPYPLLVTKDGRVTAPDFDPNQDISKQLRRETTADTLESQGTLKMREYLLTQNETPYIVVWFLPPDQKFGYPTGNIVVGLVEKEKNSEDIDKRVQTYCLSGINLPRESWSSLGQKLLFHSDNNHVGIKSVSQLRATPLFLKPPENTDSLDFIASLIPLPWAWERIKSGQARALKEEVFKNAWPVARKLASSLGRARSEYDFIVLGAMGEREMQRAGHSIRANSGCGALNTDLLSSSFSTFSHSHLRVDSQGNLSQKSESGIFARKCPYCGRAINKVISPGYTCGCGQTYSGAC